MFSGRMRNETSRFLCMRLWRHFELDPSPTSKYTLSKLPPNSVSNLLVDIE